MLKSFEWRLPTTILFGPGKLNEIGKVVQDFGKRCLIVTTRPEPWNRAMVDRVGALLATSGVESHWFSGVGGNPTTDQVSAGAAAAREFRADVVLGLGGGSAMDAAKAIAVEATHPGAAWDYLWFREKQPTSATLPVIAVSTTSGTGSQLTQVAVITKTDERCKSAIYNDIILPRVAVVDPELMLSVPPRMTAFTGFDALTHAFESFLHPNCDALVDMMAREAISIVLKWLPVAVADGKNLEARCQMALADSLAGMCILRAGVTLPTAWGWPSAACIHTSPMDRRSPSSIPAFLGYTHAAAVRQFAWLAHQIDPATQSLDDAAAAAAAPPLLTTFSSGSASRRNSGT